MKKPNFLYSNRCLEWASNPS